MKRCNLFFVILCGGMLISSVSACAPERTADDEKRDAQQKSLRVANDIVGNPQIKNFREAKTMRAIQELCDTEVVTFTYLENMIPTVVHGYTALGGKLTYIGETISYPLPYAAQFSAPESMQTYNLGTGPNSGAERYGVARLPQADPNGLFKPTSADATWILMKDPKSNKVAPVYMEPRLVALPFKLPMD